MNFDRVLSQLGEFGPWQRRNTALLWLPSAGAGINVLIAAFAVMGPRNGFRCRNDCDGQQFSFDVPGHSPSEMFPSLDSNSSEYDLDSPDYCQFYRAQPQPGGSCSFNTSVPPGHCRRGDDFAFAPFQMSRTVATDNNLVCDDYFWTIIGRWGLPGRSQSHSVITSGRVLHAGTLPGQFCVRSAVRQDRTTTYSAGGNNYLHLWQYVGLCDAQSLEVQ